VTSTRRTFLMASGLLPFSWATVGFANVDRARREPILIGIFLRGGVDGLSLCVPHAEKSYYETRPGIAIPRPGAKGGVLDLDGRFGMHPRLAPLKPAWDAGELAFVQAVGSSDGTRSHFDAQDNMETATPGTRTRDGWLARALAQLSLSGPLTTVALSQHVPLALRGPVNVLAMRQLGDARIQGNRRVREKLEHGFGRLYGAGDDALHRSGSDALDALKRLREVSDQPPENGADYPASGRPLRELAQLVKADVGLRAGWIDVGGWDTHQGQGDSERGRLPRLLDPAGRALAAFRADLGDQMERVVVLVMTEFGRTVRQNGTGGTDHGHGSMMLLMGGPVRGKMVHGTWPGLAPDERYEGRDLAVTTDFRSVLAEVAGRHLGAKDVARVLPGWKPTPALGLLRS
jgi:uncharacterized protein (DUF1501 family)